MTSSYFPAQVRSYLSLPIFVNQANKYLLGLLLWTVAALLYLTANHFHIFEPRLLTFSWVDSVTPFLPNTLWIYVSEYALYPAAYLMCKDLVNLNKYFYSFLAVYVISVIIFWIWPTTFPREMFPLPDNLNAITHYTFTSLRVTDTPANCCPSLHVASTYLSSFIFLDDQKKKFPFFFLWATAIAVSTLTTKQHYLVDVITGFMMAVLTYWVFHRFVSYYPLAKKK